MLSVEDNEAITRVGPGTLMGNLLRRYWTPACLSAEIPEADSPPVRVRLLGENLVAFRDTGGSVGLVAEHCPHRGASLYYGRNEECGLRCVYHGWKFDVEGTCVDMPSEPATSTFKDRVRLLAYPVRESGGIVWAYLGPKETMTPFRDFGTDTLPAEDVLAYKQVVKCNWIQALEGNIDTAHISWLHQFAAAEDLPDDGSDKPGYPSHAMTWKLWRHDRAPRLEVEDTWYGLKYAGIRTTPNGHTDVRVTAWVIPYSTIIASVPFSNDQGMLIPIDDDNCWRYVFTTEVPRNPRGLGGVGRHNFTPYVPLPMNDTGILPRYYVMENDYQQDREAQRTSTFSGVADFVSQDAMVTESMGPIYDRSREHLGTTDKALIRMRKMLLAAARGLEQGKQPPAVAGGLDFRSIRGAEKILEQGEDWRLLGTDDDPVVREALFTTGE